MKKKRLLIISIFCIALIAIVGIGLRKQATSQPAKRQTKYDLQKTRRAEATPTIYLHGYGAGAHSTASMIAYAEKHNGAHKVLTARISAAGKVNLQGYWRPQTKRPLIQVILTDNKNSDYLVTREWFHNLILSLQHKYHIKHYNTVAHSMGNLMTLSYQLKYGQKQGLPQLKKQVNLGAPFNGIIGIDDQPNHNYLLHNGRPKYMTQSYRALLKERHNFPSKAAVLNIYGNKEDGTNSDDDVSCVSAQSLRYLLRGKVNYREIEIKGAKGQHSQLHENPKVDRYIGQFLWSN